MGEDPEVEGMWQLHGSQETDPQQTWRRTDYRGLAPVVQVVRASGNRV